MYICDLIPRNFAELAEAVPIRGAVRPGDICLHLLAFLLINVALISPYHYKEYSVLEYQPLVVQSWAKDVPLWDICLTVF